MPKILVIERDAKIRDLLIRFLSVKGHAVTATETGEDGIARCTADAPDVVLVDLQLSDMTGIELCRTARTAGCAAPMVLMGSRRHSARPEVAEARIELDLPPCLVKPFGVDALVAAIEAGLAHRAVAEAPPSASGSSIVDLSSVSSSLAGAGIDSAERTPLGVGSVDAALDGVPDALSGPVTLPEVKATAEVVPESSISAAEGSPADSYGASSAGGLLVDGPPVEPGRLPAPLGPDDDVLEPTPRTVSASPDEPAPNAEGGDARRDASPWSLNSLQMEAVRHQPELAMDDEARYVLQPMVPDGPTDPQGIYGAIGLAQLLFRCFRDLFTGRLVLRMGPVRKVVTLVNGRPVGAESNVRSETLGYLLLQDGVIDEDQLAESVRLAAAQGIRQGEALVQMGALSPEGLTGGLRRQIRSRLLSCFPWTGAEYGLTYEPDVRVGVDGVELNPLVVIFDGIKTSFPIAPLVAHFDERNRSPVRSTSRLRDYATMLRAFTRELQVAALCDGQRTLGQVLSDSPFGLVDTLRIVRALELTGCLAFDAPREPALTAEHSSAPAPRVAVGGSLDGSLDVSMLDPLDGSQRGRRRARSRSRTDAERSSSVDRSQSIDRSMNSGAHRSISSGADRSMNSSADRSVSQSADRRPQRGRRTYARKAETGPDLIKADANFAKGRRCLEAEDVENALAHFQLACKQDPHQPLFRMYLGWTRFLAAAPNDRKARVEAHDEIKKALDQDPNQDEGFVLLGNIYRINGKTDAALRLYRKALSINRRNPHANKAIREMEGRRILEERDPQGLFGKFFNRR